MDDQEEKKIVQRHKLIANILVFIASGGHIVSVTFLAMVPFISSLLDAVYPIEGGATRRVWAFHPDYYFFDADEHFFLVSIHYSIMGFSLVCVHVSADTFFIVANELYIAVLSIVR